MLLRPAQRCAGHRGAVCRALHTVLKAEPTSIYTAATIAGKGAPTIVIDLDETILYRHRGFLDFLLLYLAPRALAGRPYESAVEAINALATRFRFVAITARWRGAEANTITWLTAHGLPDLPVMHATGMHPSDDTRVAYKAAAVRALQRGGWRPVIGVGDRPSDLRAYAGTGLRAFMVAHATASHRGPAAYLHRLYTAEQQLRASNSSTTTVPQVLYFTDDEAVHAAIRTSASSSSSSSSSTSSSSGTSGETGKLLADMAGKLNLYQPPGHSTGTGKLPPVWAQIRQLLEAEAAVEATHAPQAQEASWEDEASAVSMARGWPAHKQHAPHTSR